MDMLEDINTKLNSVIPRVICIEDRLNKLDFDTLSDIKSSTTDILAEVRGCAQSMGSFPDRIRRVSDASDTVSLTTDQSSLVTCQSDQSSLLERQGVLGDMVPMYGLVMSDSDLTELATKAGQLLDCRVDMFNYRLCQLEPTLFAKKLEFVLIQDSGHSLEQYGELTNTTVQDMTAHVQHLVKISCNILELQPDTKVLLGSLPPRYDGKVRPELVKLFNSLLLTESVIEERISVVSQSQLSCKFESKKKVERFETDLVTLTRYGRKLRDKNIAVQIAQVVPQLQVIKKTQFHKPGYARFGKRESLKKKLADFLHSL